MPHDADIFAPGFKETPYWWEAAPRPRREAPPVPAKTDVAVVGSGYTGLSAALHLARGGRAGDGVRGRRARLRRELAQCRLCRADLEAQPRLADRGHRRGAREIASIARRGPPTTMCAS